MNSGILLDTCAMIWIGTDAPLSAEAVQAMDESVDNGQVVFVSPITAWEIGLLVSKGRLQLPNQPNSWFSRICASTNVQLTEMPLELLIASSFLFGRPPNDPADRIIIATAREYGLRIMTRDSLILDYAKQGHVQAIAC